MRLMRALGPGSVSSLLKVILDVVFIALWIGAVAVGIALLAALLLSFNPDLIAAIAVDVNGIALVKQWPLVMAALIGGTLYLSGILIIVARLRQIFGTLMAGDPFQPENVGRLRIIGLALGSLELVRYAVRLASDVLDLNIKKDGDVSLTAWFSVLVVFVLAEVFREGARLRQEAELTI